MLRKISGVGGWTLLSRVFGFARDAAMAAVLGAGALADVFLIALRLPNHFRAIFAEGAFSTAFVPAYSRTLECEGTQAARKFAGQLLTLMLLSQLLLLGIALLATPGLLQLLAPGIAADPVLAPLAATLTRICFPYLLCMALLSVLAGVLNAHHRYAAAAAAPILLNLGILLALLWHLWFETPAHAAAWGVFVAGFAELALVWWAARRAGLLPRLQRPRLSPQVRQFFRALGPATVGSMGTQLALFADTIIASLLAGGALSALYYADRINQLPIGVIGIAAGTVVLPEMARRLAAGDSAGAQTAQNRTIETTLLFALPCLLAFVCVPETIMRGLFGRGAFDEAAVLAAAQTLRAYALGLLPFVLLRSVVASFNARGETGTPVKAAFAGIGLNLALKLLLMGSMAQTGLALATSVGAWLNLLLVGGWAWSRGWLQPDARLWRALLAMLPGALLVLAVLLCGPAAVHATLQTLSPRWADEWLLALLAAAAALAWFMPVVLLRAWVRRATH